MTGRRNRRYSVCLAAGLALGAALAAPPTVPQEGMQVPASVGRAPVVLVPGWGDDARVLEPLHARLVAAGWKESELRVLSFEDPVGSNREHAREIARAVVELKASTGAPRVDVVAHSMGGLATRYLLLNGGDVDIRRVIFLATPHDGTMSAFFAWGEGAREMEPGSGFLLGLRRATPVPRGVRAITIRTPVDLHVVPAQSASLLGLPDLRVCCPTHAGLLDDDGTFELIERFLKARQ